MILQAGDLGVQIDTGKGVGEDTVQRLENDEWVFFLTLNEVDPASLCLEDFPPGKYRLVKQREQER
jgi:hypothetical protein